MYSVNAVLKDWLPPIVLRGVSYLLGRSIRFRGNYKSWAAAAALCTGYDDESILEKVLRATLRVKQGEAVFERDSVIFDQIQYSWPVTAALMWAAMRNKGGLHVLDFGGSLGSSYFQNRKFLAGCEVLSWHVVEQPHFVKNGKKFIEDDTIKFYSSIEESVKAMEPNVILLSSVVQYLPDLDFLFDQINSLGASVLIFDRTPLTNLSENSICIQHVSSEIYKANYPMWLISRNRLLSHLSNWVIHESFDCAEGAVTSEAGVDFKFSGYIFERNHV